MSHSHIYQARRPGYAPVVLEGLSGAQLYKNVIFANDGQTIEVGPMLHRPDKTPSGIRIVDDILLGTDATDSDFGIRMQDCSSCIFKGISTVIPTH